MRHREHHAGFLRTLTFRSNLWYTPPMNLDLKTILKEDCTFQFYRDGSLYYKTTSGFVFGIPIKDVGSGTFNAQERGMVLMRWLRPAVVEAVMSANQP
jgi:hypothetical protein